MSYSSNVINNGNADNGSLSGWNVENAVTQPGGPVGAYSFMISGTGHMKQSVSFTSGTPIDFKLHLYFYTDYWNASVKSKMLLDVKYTDNSNDLKMIPLFKQPYSKAATVTGWNLIEQIIDVPEGKFIDYIDVSIESTLPLPYKLHIDDIQLLPNTNRVDDTSTEETLSSFTNQAILYGLEADMPVL